VRGIKDVEQAEIHTAEPLVPETSSSEFQLTIDTIKSHKSQGIYQIPAELIKAGLGQFAWRFINLLFLFGRKKNCLKGVRCRSKYLLIRREIK